MESRLELVSENRMASDDKLAMSESFFLTNKSCLGMLPTRDTRDALVCASVERIMGHFHEKVNAFKTLRLPTTKTNCTLKMPHATLDS